jgi:hypothetical protein
MRFSLRTLIVVMVLGGPALAGMVGIAQSDVGPMILVGYGFLAALVGLVALSEHFHATH